MVFDSTGTARLLLNESLIAVDSQAETSVTKALTYSLCSFTPGGGVKRDATLRWPKDLDPRVLGFGVLDSILADDNTLWLHMQLPLEDGFTSAATYLRFDMSSGRCTGRLTLPEQYGGNTGHTDMQLRPDGSILLLAATTTGESAFFTIADPLAQQPAVTGPIQLQQRGAQGFALPLDGVPSEEVFVYTDRDVYRCSAQSGAVELLTSWDVYGIQPELDPTQALYHYPQDASMHFLRIAGETGITALAVIDQAELAKLPTITVAVSDETSPVSRLRQAINAYNAANNGYRLKVVDYSSDAARTAGFDDGYQMLLQHLADGTAPDVWALTNFGDLTALVRDGALVDIYSFIDSDPELSRQDLLPGVLAAGQYGDTLPFVTTDFTVETLVGDADVVGTDIGWTWDKYEAITAAYPDALPVQNWGRNGLLRNLVDAAGSRFIDRQNRLAHLDSEEFVRALCASAEWLEQWPDALQDPRPALAQRQALLRYETISRFRDMRVLEFTFDGAVSFKGFPGSAGDSGALVRPMYQVGILSTCSDTAAAWSFVRTLLLPGYQDKLEDSFPVRIDSLQLAAQRAQQPAVFERAGNLSYPHYATPAYPINDTDMDMDAYFREGISAEQAEQVMQLLQSLDTLTLVDYSFSGAAVDELPAFYSGERTAEQTAAAIQANLQALLNEPDIVK